MLRVKHYCPMTTKHSKKETKPEAPIVIILIWSWEDLTFHFFWIKWPQQQSLIGSTFEFGFFDKMRVSSLRLAVNREEGTWLDHSRFLTSLSTCIHESFIKNYVGISYIWALEKCMSFTNSAQKLELSNQFLKAFKDHDHAYISFESSSRA